jgi:hypothetical protein
LVDNRAYEAADMAGLKFTTNLDADALYKLAFRRAQNQGYTVRAIDDRAFSAVSGNTALSVLAISTRCDFRVSVEPYDDGNELVLERNHPSLLGVIGVARVKGKAQGLFRSIADDVVQQGAQVMNEREF